MIFRRRGLLSDSPADGATSATHGGNSESREAFLDAYDVRPPAWQNQLDLFAGQWTSKVPTPGEETASGPRDDLFDDERLRWALGELGPIDGFRVLELGPLEGAHTAMLERAGAGEVVGVEAHRNAFLRCLVVKNILGLRATFLLGDFVAYLEQNDEPFDLCVASGVLYHMADPLQLLRLVAQRCERAYFWTHYYDEATLEQRPDVAARFTGETAPSEVGGFSATLHRYTYGEGAHDESFCGGSRPYTSWLTRDAILGALAHYGMTDVRVGMDDAWFPHGPALTLAARR